jgi:hypothetical protein
MWNFLSFISSEIDGAFSLVFSIYPDEVNITGGIGSHLGTGVVKTIGLIRDINGLSPIGAVEENFLACGKMLPII